MHSMQMNQITGFLDGSSIYASSLDTQRNLRQFQGGRLKAQNIKGRSLLPANPSECADETQNLSCFTAGIPTSYLAYLNIWSYF